MNEIKESIFFEKLGELFRPWMLVITIIIASAGIFFTSLYLFSSPGVFSGILFGLAILVLFILPLTLALLYYFKVLRKQTDKEKTKYITLIQKDKEEEKSRLDLLE